MVPPAPVFYRRNLPHWHPPFASLFLSWRLYGSLPSEASAARNGCATGISPGRMFARIDACLDKAKTGPHWLQDPRVAALLVRRLFHGAVTLQYFALHAFVVMPNYVHLLITPHVPVRRITNGLKGSTAREANTILGRSGQHFWQDESFDHWIRDQREFSRVQAYIERNPVSVGLVPGPKTGNGPAGPNFSRATWPQHFANNRGTAILGCVEIAVPKIKKGGHWGRPFPPRFRGIR